MGRWLWDNKVLVIALIVFLGLAGYGLLASRGVFVPPAPENCTELVPLIIELSEQREHDKAKILQSIENPVKKGPEGWGLKCRGIAHMSNDSRARIEFYARPFGNKEYEYGYEY